MIPNTKKNTIIQKYNKKIHNLNPKSFHKDRSDSYVHKLAEINTQSVQSVAVIYGYSLQITSYFNCKLAV